ncbi:MAG: DUF5060 domain-containing protein [Paludibacter sp.]|jgi:hypothetical protein|nr:DUF5060 domain-containing protein [Paludibacter sp.]
MKTQIFLFFFIFTIFSICAQQQVECWDRFEISLKHKTSGNPFNVKLSATFTNGNITQTVSGFYDGDDTYRIRFMPAETGEWRYITSSNAGAMNRQRGSFTAIPASADNHGIVQVDRMYHFKYSDGKQYYPFGTTSYAWTHADEATQDETVRVLAESGFNKIRMCVFPKGDAQYKKEPPYLPFVVKNVTTDEKGRKNYTFDYERFNPEFFQHLEKRIDDLKAAGIEADLIILHPYDEGLWGFDRMSNSVDMKYVEYLVARLSAFRNVWWSLANEWDYLKTKTVEDWKTLTRAVVKNDAYRHLCSIHGGTATYFDYWMPEFTHVSIQDEAPVQNSTAGATLRMIFHKPVICDEVGYEGNYARWGRYSPQQMTFLVTNGVMGGIYVSHGECYLYGNEPLHLAIGGQLKGESWRRIKFLRGIMESAPNPVEMSDISRDFLTSTAGDGYFFINLGKQIQDSWLFNLPARNEIYKRPATGSHYKVDIINIWEMTITEYPETFEISAPSDHRVYDKNFKKVRLPDAPYILLRIREVE